MARSLGRNKRLNATLTAAEKETLEQYSLMVGRSNSVVLGELIIKHLKPMLQESHTYSNPNQEHP